MGRNRVQKRVIQPMNHVQSSLSQKNVGLSIDDDLVNKTILKLDEVLISIDRFETTAQNICTRIDALEKVISTLSSPSNNVPDDTEDYSKYSESELLFSEIEGENLGEAFDDAVILDSNPVIVNPNSPIDEGTITHDNGEPTHDVLKASQLTEAYENGFRAALVESLPWIIDVKNHLDSLLKEGDSFEFIQNLVENNPDGVISFIENFNISFNEKIKTTERDPRDLGLLYDPETMDRGDEVFTDKADEDDIVVSAKYENENKYYSVIFDNGQKNQIVRKQTVIVKRFKENKEDEK